MANSTNVLQASDLKILQQKKEKTLVLVTKITLNNA